MRILRVAAALALILFCAGCFNPFKNPFSGMFGGGGDKKPDVTPSRAVEPTKKYAVAIGGVMSGRDELVIFESSGSARDFGSSELVCAADSDIVKLAPRPGFSTQAAGSGAQITAIKPGIASVRCKLDGNYLGEAYEVTVPPQSLIQILVAEAGQQIAEEAKIDEAVGADVVALDSVSPTASALGSVIRNRIELINQQDDPALFGATPADYNADPQGSYYDAVILADGQFSPTDKNDSTNKTFEGAEQRKLLSGENLVAYDQAVLTAAGIFSGETADTTGGSFAFRSPTADEWAVISQALNVAAIDIPTEAGFTDASFPQLSPIQILIIPEVWKYDDGRPAFVFARSRPANSYAVVNTP